MWPRRFRQLATVVGVVGAMHTTAAHADEWSLHLVSTAQLTGTDNVFSAPSDGPADGPQVEADLSVQLRPGLLASYDSRLMVHELSADLDASLYLRNSDAHTLGGRAGWRGFFTLSPRSELAIGAGVSAGTVSALVGRDPASQGNPTVVPTGNVTFIALDVGDNYSRQMTRAARLTQRAQLRETHTRDGASEVDASSVARDIGVGVGVDRAWQAHALGVEFGLNFVDLRQTTGATTLGTQQLDVRALVQWRHDLAQRWTAALDAGAVLIVPISDGEQLVAQPSFGGQLSHFPTWGSAGIAARRVIAPNLLIAQNTITDSLVANAWLPLPWLAPDRAAPTLSVQGTLGASRTQLLDLTLGEAVGSTDVVTADLALNYARRRSLIFSLRAQHLRQIGDDESLATAPSYVRNSVFFSVFWRYPDRLAGEIPVRSSLRVDRSNVTDIGNASGAPGGGGGGAEPAR